MKTLNLGWMIALVGLMALGCDDDNDRVKTDDTADTAGAAGTDTAGAGGAEAAGAGGADAAGAGGADAAGAGGADAAGAGGAGGAHAAPLEVIGEWQSMFGDQTYDETITETSWSYAAIIEYDNATNVVITQNPDGDDPLLNPNEYSRIVYTDPEGDAFYYCTSDYGLETLAEAREANGPANADDLEAGCGESGFSWTKLTKK